jgi:hypothetical protein
VPRRVDTHWPWSYPQSWMAQSEIKGSTTIVELLKRFPDGRAAKLMSDLNWACAHCGGAFHEPLTMAAKRHARDPMAVLDAFRALENGGPSPQQVERAREMVS